MSDDMATTMDRETAQRPGRPSPVSPDEPAGSANPGGRKRTVFIIMGVVLLALVAVGVRRWIYCFNHVSTDNSQVDGHSLPILPKVGGVGLGWVSGRARVGRAEAKVAQAWEMEEEAHTDLERIKRLAERDMVPKQAL